MINPSPLVEYANNWGIAWGDDTTHSNKARDCPSPTIWNDPASVSWATTKKSTSSPASSSPWGACTLYSFHPIVSVPTAPRESFYKRGPSSLRDQPDEGPPSEIVIVVRVGTAGKCQTGEEEKKLVSFYDDDEISVLRDDPHLEAENERMEIDRLPEATKNVVFSLLSEEDD